MHEGCEQLLCYTSIKDPTLCSNRSIKASSSSRICMLIKLQIGCMGQFRRMDLSRRRAFNRFGIVRIGSLLFMVIKSCLLSSSTNISVYSDYWYVSSSTDDLCRNLVTVRIRRHGFIDRILYSCGGRCIRKLTRRLGHHMADSLYQSCPTCTSRFIQPRSSFLRSIRQYSTPPPPKFAASAVAGGAKPRVTAEEARRAVEAARQRMYKERANKNRSILLYSAGSVSK